MGAENAGLASGRGTSCRDWFWGCERDRGRELGVLI